MTAAASLHLGLDLGATNLKWVVARRATDGWAPVDRDQVPTRGEEGPEAVVARLAAIAGEVIDTHPGIASVGIGVPGLYDPATGSTRFLPNLPGEWAGRPVAGPVAEATGRPTALVNDARAVGLAELRMGGGRGARSMVGMTLGTGVGGVIAIDGRVHQGHDGTGGELGHQTIDLDGPTCACGNRGCVEAYARADVIAAACGTRTVEEAVDRARAGDEAAVAGLDRVGRKLGVGIANAIVLVNPDRVVIGGGIAAAGELLLGPIRAEVRERVRVTSLDEIEIVAAELGTWAGATGAAVHGAERALEGGS
jgi:glucokinase